LPTFEDIIYAVDGSAAVITINRPEVYNADRTERNPQWASSTERSR
jgi:1,4-dihydroxy-2-naphthoyl-CoA synthase